MKTIDIKFYPHLFDDILAYASTDAATLLNLRLVNSIIRERVDAELWRYVRMTDEGLQDSRGLVMDHIPLSLKMHGKHILDMDVTDASGFERYRPGVIRFLRRPAHPECFSTGDLDLSDADDSDDSEWEPDADSDAESDNKPESEDGSESSDSEVNLQLPNAMYAASAADACVLFTGCVGVSLCCTAPTMCFTIDLSHSDPGDPWLAGLLKASLYPSQRYFFVLQVGVGGKRQSSLAGALPIFASIRALLLLHQTVRVMFVIRAECSSGEPFSAEVHPKRLPTVRQLKYCFDDSLEAFPSLTLTQEGRRAIEYITLSGFRRRVGDHMFKLMTDKSYSG